MNLREGTIAANGLDFAYLAAGPDDGPLALCLHGFPDTAWTWRHLLPALAEAGYWAVAPFMRGYAPTAVPADGGYHTGNLVADACGLHEALGGDARAVLIGHDWGATAVYGAAAFAPERWSRVVAMAVPPPAAIAAGFQRFDQLKRSWYMFFFQLPLADFLVPMNNMEFIARLWADWSPGFDGTEDVAHVRDSLGPAGHMAAALGYYRATFGGQPPAPEVAAEHGASGQPITQPLLYLHGRDDGCIGIEVAQTHPDTVVIDGAGHFLQLERPDEVNKRVLEFLGG